MRRQCRHSSLLLVIMIGVLILICEEYYMSKLINVYNNHYRTAIYGSIVMQPRNGTANSAMTRVAIVTIVLNSKNEEEYSLARQTLDCYARYHRYQRLNIILESNATLKKLCPHHDFMFARHCVVAQIMTEIDSDWILFVDADISVINPNHLIENWIDTDVDLIFYNRIFNHEVMSGSYLARKSAFSLNFLKVWANYESKLPHSMHGSDNGALHNVILEVIYPVKIQQRLKCEKLWKKSTDYSDLSVYEVCVRKIIGDAPKWPGKIKILPKGTAWVRDTWLTNSMWCKNDFMLHGWQKKIDGRRIDGVLFAAWPSPLVSHYFNISVCSIKDMGLNWKYKDTFIRSNREIAEMIDRKIDTVHDEYERISKQILHE